MDKRIPVIFVLLTGSMPTDEPVSNNNNGNFPYRILSNPNQITAAIDQKKLDANQISTWYKSNGSFNNDPTTQTAGFEWPKGFRKIRKIFFRLMAGMCSW